VIRSDEDLPTELGEASDVPVLCAKVGANDEVFPPKVTSHQEEKKPTLDDRDISDADNASRLIELHGEILHFVPAWKKWLRFSDHEQRWIEDHANVQVHELAKDVGQRLKLDAFKIADRTDAKKKFHHALKSLSNTAIESMVKLARGIKGIPLDHELLDSDPWLLGVRNGVLDLKTGECSPADPANLMTMQCAVAFDKNADCLRWDAVNEDWFPDQEVRDYVQRVAGSALVGAQRDHAFIIHYGGGRNGKGTFIRALQRVFGAYATVPHLSLLMETRSTQHDTVRAALFRARLAVASETKQRVSLDESSVKNLTGNDRISARRMRENLWEFDPTHSLWLQTNYLPKISGTDTGIWSRIRVVKWETTFQPEEQDKDLDDVLAAEAPGILNWLLKGCLAWQQHGLNEPESVKRETLAYRDREDVIKAFMSEVGLALDPSLEITSPELQRLFREWSGEAGLRNPSQSDLLKVLKKAGCTLRNSRIDGKRVRVWEGFGVQLTEEDEEFERDEREGLQQY
jgi:putative DNA primase/helicase